MEKRSEQESQRLIIEYETREQVPLEINAYQDRKSLGLLVVTCFSIPAFLFLATGVFLIEKARYTGNVSYNDILSFVIAVGSTGLVFGALGLWITLLLGKPRVLITINTQEIIIGKSTSRFKLALPWPEIASIYMKSRQSQKWLCIRPKNLEQYLARYGRVMRLLLRLNVAMIGAPLGVAQNLLDISIEDLLQRIASDYATQLERNEVQLRAEL